MSEEVPTTPTFETGNQNTEPVAPVTEVAPEAEAIVQEYEAAKTDTGEAAVHAAALLAMHQEAQRTNQVRDIEAQAAREDWPQDRLDAAMANLKQNSPTA